MWFSGETQAKWKKRQALRPLGLRGSPKKESKKRTEKPLPVKKRQIESSDPCPHEDFRIGIAKSREKVKRRQGRAFPG